MEERLKLLRVRLVEFNDMKTSDQQANERMIREKDHLEEQFQSCTQVLDDLNANPQQEEVISTPRAAIASSSGQQELKNPQPTRPKTKYKAAPSHLVAQSSAQTATPQEKSRPEQVCTPSENSTEAATRIKQEEGQHTADTQGKNTTDHRAGLDDSEEHHGGLEACPLPRGAAI